MKLRGVFEQLDVLSINLTAQMTEQLFKTYPILATELRRIKPSYLHFVIVTLGHAVSMFIFVFCLLVPKFSLFPPLKAVSDRKLVGVPLL